MAPLPNHPSGALLYIDANGEIGTIDPPVNDGQGYVLGFDATVTRPAWLPLGGYGTNFGTFYGRAL